MIQIRILRRLGASFTCLKENARLVVNQICDGDPVRSLVVHKICVNRSITHLKNLRE